MENKPSVLTQRYEIGRLLGQGTFAKVYFARRISTNQSVAIKVIDKEKVLRVGMMNQIKREISVMRIARHPNIVQLYEVMATKTRIYFIMEYCKGGELFNKVAKGRLKEDVARKYFVQLINAVDFCHSRGVYHRDIKPENLLLDENENLKVSDFGLSALAESRHQDGLLHTTCGTPAYVAPEVINRKGYDGAAADIWSCGVVLFVLLAGYLPFHDSNLMEMYRKIGRAEYRCPNSFPPEARKLLLKILDPNPSARLPVSKIKECSWFRKGLHIMSKKKKPAAETGPPASSSSDIIGTSSSSGGGDGNGNSSNMAAAIQPSSNLNAFDIISLSAGFDLSRLFEDYYSQKRETIFTSRQPAPVIISKLEETGRQLRLKVKKKEDGVVKMEGSKEGRKGILSIDAEIFQVTPTFHLVEMKKSNGDTMEYQQMMKQDMRPALQDIVWVWQGEKQPDAGHPQPESSQQQQQQQQV